MTMSEPITDAELVRQAKAGELGAFEDLTRRHERQVYSLASGSCARNTTPRT